MAMMVRRLGPVRYVMNHPSQFGGCSGMRATLVPESMAGASISSPVDVATRRVAPSSSNSTNRRAFSAAAVGARGFTNTIHRRGCSAPLRRRDSGGIRRSTGSSGFVNNRAPSARLNLNLNPNPGIATKAGLYGARGGASSPCTTSSRGWQQSGGGESRVVFLQAASLRTTSFVSGPAAAAGDGKTPPPETSSSRTAGASSSSPGSSSSSGDGATADGTRPGSPLQSGSAEKVDPSAVKSAASIGDERTTVKGGNPSCRAGDGSFMQMRNRMRHARFDASEDAKDWMRDKRNDMNTMKETLRDARQDLKDARRDGRLGEQLSDRAKESSGRMQVLWRQYGAVGIGTYFGIYFGSIAFFYVVYDYGVLTNLPSGGTAVIEHMQEWMKSAPEWAQGYSDRLFGAMVEDHRARSFVLAWATCKVLEPLRLVGAIAITPRLARAMGRAPSKVVDDASDDGDGDGDGGAKERKGS